MATRRSKQLVDGPFNAIVDTVVIRLTNVVFVRAVWRGFCLTPRLSAKYVEDDA